MSIVDRNKTIFYKVIILFFILVSSVYFTKSDEYQSLSQAIDNFVEDIVSQDLTIL